MLAFISPPPDRNSHPCPKFPSLVQSCQQSLVQTSSSKKSPQKGSCNQRWRAAAGLIKHTLHALLESVVFFFNLLILFFLPPSGARPKFTERNSMDSVELWKYSSDKVIYCLSLMTLEEKYVCRWETPNFYLPKTSAFITICFFFFLPQNGENQDPDSMTRKSKGQPSQAGKRKGYPDSQSSDERSWLDSPVDTDDITVQVPPPVPVSNCCFKIFSLSVV